MKGSARVLLVTLALVVLGSLMLRGFAEESKSDPTASVDNGAPRGLLLLRTWLARRGVDVIVLRAHDGEAPVPAAGRAVLIVPPPERAAWTKEEVRAHLARVQRGLVDVVVLCDEDEARQRRLGAWMDATGLRCRDVETGGPGVAVPVLPSPAARVFVRGDGRVGSEDGAAAAPLWVDEEGRTVAARVDHGAGRVVFVGSATPLANDGLAREQNAAFAWALLRGAPVVAFAEAHHRSRGREALAAAARGIGPATALFALALLVPFSLLSLVPRPGDPPRGAGRDDVPLAASSQVRALAALYARAVDRERPPRGVSRP